jgi:glycosyltransferase involved in cell wall biosynthesis/ubiquinone/menaquinone biosynthesis C-methylase UbiE
MQNTISAFMNEPTHPIRYNILFLTKWYPNKFDPQLGVFVQKHAKAVSAYCNVCVLNVCADDALTDNYEITLTEQSALTEIIVYYKKNNSIFKSIINLYRYLKASLKGIREAQQTIGVIDLIHVHVLTRTGIVAYLINKLKGIPYIITEHWTGYVSGKYEKSSGLKIWITKLVIKNAKAVTTVSESLKRKMIALGLTNNYTVVPNVIESVTLAASTTNTKTKILTVADLVDAHKNISDIIKTIIHISKKNASIEYHIIGDGPDKQLLTRLADSLQGAEKFIFFHGRKNNEYVYNFLKQVDFVVINSNFETFSVVAAEALANGKPVISTICGGPEEFITTEYGLLIEPNNTKQLEEAIVKMIASHKTYDAQKLNHYITQKYNYQTIGKQFYTIYKPLIKNFTVGLSGKKLPIEPEWSVLDVGSGHRPNRRANVLIDNELNETEHRSGKKANVPLDKKMVVGDALHMPFSYHEFDFIIASHIAEHIDDPEQFCKELARVGKRGYIETPGPVDEFFLNEPFHKWVVSKKNNCLIFTEKKNFKPFSHFFYGLYYLNETRTGHKPLHSSNSFLKLASKCIGKSWSHLPKTYTRFYWEHSINVKVIRK